MSAPSSERRDAAYDMLLKSVRVDEETGCWIWTKGDSGNGRGGGYGRVYYQGQMVAAHRLMYVLTHGYLHRSQQVDHTCCNRRCINPAHLQATTHKENQRRRAQRQKQKGQTNG